MSYAFRISQILTPAESRILKKLRTPSGVQDYLEALPINFEPMGDTYMSPREVLKAGKCHCFEGALLAALALAYQGRPPLLMDFRCRADEDDHVVALFKENGYWGAISKTNHPVLRWRDPVYKTPRELAMSYFHEYFAKSDKQKMLREFSAPFDLRKYSPERWVVADGKLQWLADALDASRHFPAVPKKNKRKLRRINTYEWAASELTEWIPSASKRSAKRRFKGK